MTISSSLNAGVAGLNANATRLATISDNISNASTYGYRRAEAEFNAMVIKGSSDTAYSAGGVRVTPMRLIDERGSLVTTSNATDISVDGRGFLPVTQIAAVDAPDGTYPLSLMTTGSFRRDAEGVLRTESGMVLMGWPANSDGSIPAMSRDTQVGLVPVQINNTQFAADPTTQIELGVNLPATATAADATGEGKEMSVVYYGNLGTAETLDITFTPTIPVSGSSNTWTMTITDSASGGAEVGEYTLVFDDARDSGGRLLSVANLSGGPYNSTTGEIALTVGGGPLTLNIGVPGQQNGMTQLSDTFATVQITKNGTPVANMTGLEVDANGYLYGIYDEGFTRRLFQIPLVDVPNPNGLIVLNNQSYQISAESGPFFLWDAGEGPTGAVVGFSREESATDVAAELTQLIQTQRAYSSNAKVIQTVDEMLQETTNIKR
jgi:flagellar hook protein FlgE